MLWCSIIVRFINYPLKPKLKMLKTPRNKEKKYTVVQFMDEDNSIESIPSLWVDEADASLCWWPPSSTEKRMLKNYILTQEPPNPLTWQRIKIKKIKKSSTFLRAEIIANRYLMTSNLSSESSMDDTPKRKRRREDMLKRPINQIPPAPKTLSSTEASVHLDESFSDTFSVMSDSSSNDICNDSSKSSAACSDPSSAQHLPIIHKETSTLVDSTASLQGFNLASPVMMKDIQNIISPFAEKMLKLQEQVLAELKQIRKRQDRQEKQLMQLESNSTPTSTTTLDDDLAMLQNPLKTIEDIMQVENVLLNKDIANKLALYLSTTTDGCDAASLTKNIMQKVLSKAVALEYSYCGRQKKKSFKDLRLCGVVFDAVSKRYDDQFAAVKRKISIFLAGAGDRDGGRQCRAKTGDHI